MITWDQITAECDGYRAGFVAVFHKYEGQETDERDESNRVVKVTVSSFAEHVGVPRSTFQQWVRGAARVRHNLGENQTRTGAMGRQIAKSPVVAVEDKVGMLKDLISSPSVMRAWREQKDSQVSESDAKAAKAAASAFAQKVGQAFTGLEVPMWLDQLKEMTETLREYEYDEDSIGKLARAARRLMDEIEVQQFRLGMVEEVEH